MTHASGADADVASAPSRRAVFEARQRRRSNTIATISTLVALAAVIILVPLLPGWEDVQFSFFNGETFRKSFPRFLKVFWYDVQIFLICAPCIVVVGLLVAFARNVRSPALYPLKLFATLYTDIVRGVPVVLWILLLGFGVPGLFQSREWYSKAILWAAFALVMTYSAYVSEVFRAGIESIHESQRGAARSLGLSASQTMRHVVLPQAVRRVVPPLMNDFVSLQKDVALVSFVGPVEVLRRAGIETSRDFNYTHYVVADWLLARERRQMSGTAVR
jgi:polar amino acid transport system permease protein